MPRDKQKASSRMDMTMLTLVILLTVFGLVILLSASEYNGRVRFHDSAYYFKKQLFASALGLGAMYFVSSIDYHFFCPARPGSISSFHAALNSRASFWAGDQRFQALAESRSSFFPAI